MLLVLPVVVVVRQVGFPGAVRAVAGVEHRNQKSLLDLMVNGRRSKVRSASRAAASVTPPYAKAAA
jgi:hypothetical protein